MSVVMMGLSHHTAPMELLDVVALSQEQAAQLERTALDSPHVVEAVVLATCNRIEVYVDAVTFHGAVSDIAEALSLITGVPTERISPHVAVHYEERAIHHVLSVACGLDSMAVGEPQILGQMRAALRRAQELGHVGTTLNPLLQQALRVGKRAHTETDIDKVSGSLVDAALIQASEITGPLASVHAAVVGAGAMSSLAAITAHRAGASRVTIVNRTLDKAQRLAASIEAEACSLDSLDDVLSSADIVLSCTGAVGTVITAPQVRQAREARETRRNQVFIDLALPHDIDPAVAQLEGAHLVRLGDIGRRLSGHEINVDAVYAIVEEELAAYQVSRRQLEVAPTIAALRRRASVLTAAEMERLESRLPQLDESTRAEVQRGVHRVVEKLLHTPTVRVKELAGEPGPSDYAHALQRLFDLDGCGAEYVTAEPTQGAATTGDHMNVSVADVLAEEQRAAVATPARERRS